MFILHLLYSYILADVFFDLLPIISPVVDLYVCVHITFLKFDINNVTYMDEDISLNNLQVKNNSLFLNFNTIKKNFSYKTFTQYKPREHLNAEGYSWNRNEEWGVWHEL